MLDGADVQCSEPPSCEVTHKKEVEFAVGYQAEEAASVEWQEPACSPVVVGWEPACFPVVVGREPACCPVVVDREPPCFPVVVGRHVREGQLGMPYLVVGALHLLEKNRYTCIC